MRVAEQVDKTLLRLSAKYADQVRDAIRASVNVDTVTREFLQTFPTGSTVTRQQARDWARHHVAVNSHALGLAVDQLHAVGYVLGVDYSSAAYNHVVNGIGKAVDANNATFALGFDWSTWTPGNRAAEALVRPPGGLARLLDRNNRAVTIKDMNDTTLDRIGTRLADGLAVGATDTAIAQSLRDVVGDPQRALMISQTEMNRATSSATVDNYNELGVEQVEWFALDGCEDCELNAEAGPVPMGDEFPSGDTEPPLHPNCRCCLLPFIEGDSVAVRDGGDEVSVDDEVAGDGVDAVAPAELDMPEEVDVVDTAGDMPEPELTAQDFITQEITEYPQAVFDEVPMLPSPTFDDEKAWARYVGSDYRYINEYLREGGVGDGESGISQTVDTMRRNFANAKLEEPISVRRYSWGREFGYDSKLDPTTPNRWIIEDDPSKLVGTVFESKAFFSTTAGSGGGVFPEHLSDRTPVEMRVNLPAGTRAGRVPGGFRDEYEVLVDANSRFLITGATNENGKIILDLLLVGQ